MNHTKSLFMRWGALAVAFAAVAALPALASAKTTLVELRVEGPDSTLDPGTFYAVHDTSFGNAEAPDCDPLPGKSAFEGLSALTTLGSGADANRDLDPVRVVSFDFGPQVCQIADLRSFGTFPDANGGFNYWVNFEGGLSSADVASVERNDSVLWYYVTYPPFDRRGVDPANAGNTLELKSVPPAHENGTFIVRVVEHQYDGTPSPFEGAQIDGADTTEDLGNGRYRVTVPSGFTTLSAIDPARFHVKSNQFETCVRANLDRCPSAHGRTIVGSQDRENVRGTRGWDDISTRGGDDRINISNGGRDRVNCGPGDDKVLVGIDEDDRVRANCETVIAG